MSPILRLSAGIHLHSALPCELYIPKDWLEHELSLGFFLQIVSIKSLGGDWPCDYASLSTGLVFHLQRRRAKLYISYKPEHGLNLARREATFIIGAEFVRY